jgi:hypothetical protein
MAHTELQVRSTVIDWPAETLEITDKNGVKHVVSLDTPIHVVMIGFPNQEEQDILARKLGYYMQRGYIIMRISYETAPEKPSASQDFLEFMRQEEDAISKDDSPF